MEQIYTIPVNEAFEAGMEDPGAGCPLCALWRQLEENELDLILGASFMEPDIRIRTNREGFCRTHYDMMFVRKNRLGMGLTLESHIAELKKELKAGGVFAKSGEKPVKRIRELEDSCYICSRVENNFSHMTETAVYLWETDGEFPAKLKGQSYFCLPHYRRLLEVAAKRLGKRKYPEFVEDLSGVEETYLDKLGEDVSWFCKKFDYRYQDEPWKDSKDAVERAIRVLRSDLHNPPPKK